MSADPLAEEFYVWVQRLGWFREEQLQRIRDKAADRGVTPLQAALELGLLDSNRLDALLLLLDRNDPIPGYEIQDLVGQGGMGTVYRARQKTLDRIVAVKTVQLKSIENPTALERF